ncbi:MAG: AMP-binding protein, partial [Anaerolineae bacterium]
DPAIGLRAVGRCLEDASPEVFIGNGVTDAIGRFYGWSKKSVRKRIRMQSLFGPRQDRRVHTEPLVAHPDAEAAIIFTSGSTGTPKGAVYTHGNFAALLDVLTNTFGIREDEIDLPAFPIFLILDCLLGVTAIVPDMRFPSPARTDAQRVLEAANQFHVTNMFASPVALDRIAAYARRSGQRLEIVERVITAGAPAPARVLEAFASVLSDEARFFGIYGATEALIMSVVDQRDVLAQARHQMARGAGVCIGRPVNGACIRILPITDEPVATWEATRELPANCVGEITIRGPHVTRQYAGRADLNDLHKIADTAGVVHRTGDLGYFDERGLLWYCGRKSHRVATTAGTMFTEQVEGIFNAHPPVRRTALVGWRGEPVLWIELEAPASSTDKDRIVAELRELAQADSQASQIERFLFIKRFPTDVRHNSKIIREKLAVMAQERLG